MEGSRSCRVPLCLFVDHRGPRLYDHVVGTLRTRHYSPRTEEAYVHWIGRFIRFCGSTHPRELNEENVNCFLTDLAVRLNVAASTQNQALAAVLFLYEHVLQQPLSRIDGIVRARKPKLLPVVLTREEVEAVLCCLRGDPKTVGMVLYGSGPRLLEGLGLRAKDVEFGRNELVIRDGKGQRDRVTMLPDMLHEPLRAHLELVRERHEADLCRGEGRVARPHALARKYPNADREWAWQWVFPASSHYRDRVTGIRHRHHLHESVIQKAVREAAARAGVPKTVTPRAFRHSFATHLLEDGYDIRTVQELLGHKSVKTTMIYTHVLNRGGRGVRSPLDKLSVSVVRSPAAYTGPRGSLTNHDGVTDQ